MHVYLQTSIHTFSTLHEAGNPSPLDATTSAILKTSDSSRCQSTCDHSGTQQASGRIISESANQKSNAYLKLLLEMAIARFPIERPPCLQAHTSCAKLRHQCHCLYRRTALHLSLQAQWQLTLDIGLHISNRMTAYHHVWQLLHGTIVKSV
jgi:hypothetical protein